MEKPIQVSVTADRTMAYTRVVNTILASLPDDYKHFDDVFELRELCENIDRALRSAP